MSDTALKSILDREGVSTYVQANHASAIRLLEELVDFGTNLIARAHENSSGDFPATYLLFVHLHQLVAHLDSVSVQLKKGCCLSAHLQLRVLLENHLFLKWILKDGTDNKIEHIFVANVRRDRYWQSVGIPGTPAATEHATAAGKLSLPPEAVEKLKKRVANLDKVLADPPSRAAINLKFEEKREELGYDPNWYALCGARTVRQIATQINELDHYTYLYGPFSGVTHGSDISYSIIHHREQVEVIPIRNANDFKKLCQLAATFALDAYLTLIQKYLPDETADFRQKYLTEWQEPYKALYPTGSTPEFTVS